MTRHFLIEAGGAWRPARVALVAVAVVALAGCSTVRGWFGGDEDEGEDLTEPAPLVEFTPSITPQRIWSTGVGKGERRLGIRQSPAVADGRVYASGVDGGVRALDLQSGSTVWTHETEQRVSGGPSVGDGLVVYGTLEGEVVALDAATGAERWTAKVGNEIVAPPAIGQGMVLVRSNQGRVTAFDATGGERRWFWNHDLPPLTVRGNDAPVLGPGFVFVGNDDGSLSALALADGRPVWQQAIGQPDGRTELDRMADVDGAPLLEGATLFASSYKKATLALEGPSGRPVWQSDRGGAGRLGSASDRLVVADVDGVVWALDKTSGSALWSQSALRRRNPGGIAVQGDYAVVADIEGYIHWMKLSDGEFAARERAGRDPVRGAPVVSDGILLVQTVDGDLTAWRIGQ